MKVLLYTEGEKLFAKSGLGKAIKHQMRALEYEKVEYTTNIKDDYDIVHINWYGPNSFALAKIAKKKGKKAALIGGISAAVIVGGSAAAYGFSDTVKNQVKLRLSKPENYYAWVT